MSTPPTPCAFPHRFEQQAETITVVGIELRTTNLEAMQTIPPHWERFANEAVLDRIAGRVDADVLAVYTHFAHAGRDNTGLYSLVIGARVTPDAAVPPGMVRVVVPASPRAVFALPARRPDLVGPAWHAVWEQTHLPKTFVAEYERYAADGGISISIGLTAVGA
jgi:predicted transcriptional regulator YdeE